MAVAAAVGFVLCASAKVTAAIPGLTERARLAAIYDEILSARLDQARTQLEQACPPAPPVACLALRGVADWWDVVLDPQSRRVDGRLQASAKQSIEAAAAWTAREPERAEAWFYLAGAHAPLVQWRILRGQRLAAARDGSRIKAALERALELDPTMHDAKFGIGLYHYYADVVPAPAKIVRWLLWLPGGDRVRGLREMLEARDRGALLVGEADFQLHWLYLWYERQPSRALELLRGLTTRYPANPVFHQRIAEVQADYFHDHPASAATWSELLERAVGGRVSAAKLAEARAHLGLGIELDAMDETDRAIEQFERVVRSLPTVPHEAGAEALVRLGAAHDRLGDRTSAVAFYRRAALAADAAELPTISGRAKHGLAHTPNARAAEAYRLSLEGLRALERRDVDAAWTALERAASLAPNEPGISYRTARVLLARGDHGAARARLVHLVQQPRGVPALVRAAANHDLAVLYERDGDRDRAVSHFRSALSVVGGALDVRSAARASLARLTK